MSDLRWITPRPDRILVVRVTGRYDLISASRRLPQLIGKLECRLIVGLIGHEDHNASYQLSRAGVKHEGPSTGLRLT